MKTLYWNTVNQELKECLEFVMQSDQLQKFRLVGGTALSLHLGHRISVDIDLFSEEPYGSLNFDAIDDFLRSNYNYVSDPVSVNIGFGRSYLIGKDSTNLIKLDLYYTDPFLEKLEIHENVRMASISEIAAMKIDVIQRGGRKKDFWDIHELLDKYGLDQLLGFHVQKYPYNHEKSLILANMSNFERADSEPDPLCLRGKYWDLIKLDIVQAVEQL
ncbi:nucleotidyl transferase AbiEii/AbiGii toxin family protein [Cyclobacteriaceae bacterium YHN15]|nr:nucleotidyl transferase AbiEii/AbiGii toxin family protein [Cyclobacteriaceae bacterium YHN15]